MEYPTSLEIHPAPHPKLVVHRAGFGLDHPYVEQCWGPVLGPSSVALLRRLPWLWRDQVPATVAVADLGAQLGLGRGDGRHSPIARTVERVVRFRFATWSAPGVLDVFTEVPPLPRRHLERLTEWCGERHEQLLSAHLEALALRAEPPPAPVPVRRVSSADRMRERLAPAHRSRSDHPRHGTKPMTFPGTPRGPATPSRDHTLRMRDADLPLGQTLAGSPPGNLRPTRRAGDASR